MGMMTDVAYPERDGAALRYPAAGLALVSELIHLWVLPGQFVVAMLPGTFFLLVAISQGLLAVNLLFGPGRWTLRFGVLLNLFVVFVWSFTRVVSVPELFAPVRLPLGGLDLAASRNNWKTGAAIRCARGLEGVDPERIALWGSSFGSGHVVVVAAEDPRVAAVAAQIPFNGFPRRAEGRSTLDTLRLFWAMTVDAARGRLGLSPRYVPMVGKPGEVAVTATPELQEHIAALSGETRGSLWRNEVAPRGLFGMMRYKPGEVAHRLGMPVLVCVAERDSETPEELTRRIAERAPRGEFRRYPGTHFDFYRDPVRQQVLTDQIVFLRTHLAVENRTKDRSRRKASS